jgi:hypothetical protein
MAPIFSRMLAAGTTFSRSDNENTSLDNRDYFSDRTARRQRRAEADFLRARRARAIPLKVIGVLIRRPGA